VKEAKLTFYNIDAVKDKDEVYIQEGEIDTMSAYQCNIFNSVSVPNGATIGSNARLEYLDNCIDTFGNKKKIIIATDGDIAGRALRDELIRRFGAERCWIVEYPDGCKDTNEVLLKYGPDEVRRIYKEAKQVPLEGVFTGDDVRQRVFDIYDNGFPETLKAGYAEFDKLLTFRAGELTIVTGIPGHGKTTFLDQILVRLAARYDWRTAIFSPENDVALHNHKLISKFMGEPSVTGKSRLSREKLTTGIDFINDHFYFMKYDEMNTTIEGILGKAKELVIRKGINALVIDPYNCIEHKIPHGYSETQYISELLTKLTSFAKINGVHIFLVAHPTKIEKDKKTLKYEVPTLYKISGSANFFNKTDNGFTVYLDPATGTVEVHVQKVKFDFVGEKGVAVFYYDKATGRYTEPGCAYENEYELYMKRINEGNQASLTFNEPQETPTREQGQLTDINSLPITNSFDFQVNAGEPPF
jgi:twinkle protein